MAYRKLTDDDLMPFGLHKGKAMANVPADYFLYLLRNGLEPGNVRDYIEENLEILKEEAGVED